MYCELSLNLIVLEEAKLVEPSGLSFIVLDPAQLVELHCTGPGSISCYIVLDQAQ